MPEVSPEEIDPAATGAVAALDRAAADWNARARQAEALGFKYERRYHGCGQCVVAALLETLGRQDDGLFAAATGLCGGLGLAGDATCGALVGASLVIGSLYPRRREHFDGDRENKYRTFAMIQRLQRRYLEAYGGITCHQIHRATLGRAFDLRQSVERTAFEAAGAHDDKCTAVVARAAAWAIEIIAEEAINDVPD